jgi:hypothetical protein
MREDIEFYNVIPPKDSEFKFTCVVGVGRSDQSLWIQVAVTDQKSFDWLADLQEQDGAVVLEDGAGRIFVEMRAVIAACKSPEEQKRLIAGAEAWLENLHASNFRNGPIRLYETPDSSH